MPDARPIGMYRDGRLVCAFPSPLAAVTVVAPDVVPPFEAIYYIESSASYKHGPAYGYGWQWMGEVANA